MISVCFQGKPFNTTVIQAYAPTSDAEAEAPILWPLDAKSQLPGKDPDAWKF